MNKKYAFCNKNNMQESKFSIVLEVLINECQDGGYRILEKTDLLSLAAKRCKITESDLEKIVSSLEKEELISLKYEDENVYCIAVLPKGIKMNEDKKNKEKRPTFPRLNYFLIFLISFIACFIACLIANLILF